LSPSEEGLQNDSAAGGMGLGEGEGENDISDKIESEDQFEDARPEGEEKAEEDEECKACLQIINSAINFKGYNKSISVSRLRCSL
jgi:midasin